MSEIRYDHYGIVENSNIPIEVELYDGTIKSIFCSHKHVIFQGNLKSKDQRGKVYDISDGVAVFKGYIENNIALDIIRKCSRENRGRGTVLWDKGWHLWDFIKDGQVDSKKLGVREKPINV
jgi:hypothetical protein